MLDVEATVVIDRPPAQIIEWISDLERYRSADTKITKVLHQDPGRVRYRGRLRGLPTPSDENLVEVVPDRSITFRGAPGRWTRRLLDFEGGFELEPEPGGGTRVRHHESLGFKPGPVRLVAEAYLRRWMERDIADEVVRLKTLIEAES